MLYSNISPDWGTASKNIAVASATIPWYEAN